MVSIRSYLACLLMGSGGLPVRAYRIMTEREELCHTCRGPYELNIS